MPKGEQNGTKEDGHIIAVGDDVVMENVQPARQFEVFNAFPLLPRTARLYRRQSRSKLLLATDGETTAIGWSL